MDNMEAKWSLLHTDLVKINMILIPKKTKSWKAADHNIDNSQGFHDLPAHLLSPAVQK